MPRYRLYCCDIRLEGLPVDRISSGDVSGKYIALVSRAKGYAFLHNLSGEKLANHSHDVFQAVRVAPSGFHIVYARSGRLYAFKPREPVPYWEKNLGKLGAVTAIDMSKSSRPRIAVGGEKGLLILSGEGVVEYSSKLCRGAFCKPKVPLALAWSKSGRLLAVSTKDSKLLVLTSSGELVGEATLPSPSRKLAWSESGLAIVAGLLEGSVALIALTDKGLSLVARRRLGERIDSVASSPLGDILVAWRSGRESFMASLTLDLKKTLWLENIGEYRVKRIGVPEDHPPIVITDYSEAIFTLEVSLEKKRGEEVVATRAEEEKRVAKRGEQKSIAMAVQVESKKVLDSKKKAAIGTGFLRLAKIRASLVNYYSPLLLL